MATKVKAKKAEKKDQPKKPTKEQKQKLVNEKIDELMIARRKYSESCMEWRQAHAEAGAAKKHMEKLQADLNGIVSDIERIRSGNFTLPLPFGKPVGTSAATPGSDDQRMAVQLTTLFDGAILKSLVEAKIETVGDLANWSSTKQLADIPGIGPGKGGKIEERMIQFWSENPPIEKRTPAVTDDIGESQEGTESAA